MDSRNVGGEAVAVAPLLDIKLDEQLSVLCPCPSGGRA